MKVKISKKGKKALLKDIFFKKSGNKYVKIEDEIFLLKKVSQKQK